VTLITDIVRCAVQFETAADMQNFVLKWIMKYGIARRNATKVGWLTIIRKETQEFFRIFGEHLRRATTTPQARSPYASTNDTSYDMLPLQPAEDFKLFEIYRIRNRLDPDLIEVPGGYRDLAFKLKIGFVR
jgi:hypothetical protein